MVPAEYADDPDAYDGDRRYSDYRSEYPAADDYEPYPEQRGPRRRPAGADPAARGEAEGYEPERGARPRRSWSPETHGALAVEPQREPVSRLRPTPEPAGNPLARITTLHLRSY
ncbi:cell division protein SepF, partial [Saccharothrix sp. MB29]|nr:cell division protein SepF [Saccharothrix sp. MB29]